MCMTYQVKQDGTGHFTQIQTAINTAVHGDTIIVSPGRYMENLNYYGKNITVTSLFRYSNNRQDIANTIIDAHQSGSGVLFINSESRQAVLDGFTIENGTGHEYPTSTVGGAINIAVSSPQITNCIMQNNTAINGVGGGICIASYQNIVSHPKLTGNIIKNNKSVISGGGIFVDTESLIEFDPINRNSIFNNMAGSGHDICIFNTEDYLSVVLDTFSVATPDHNFINVENDFHFETNVWVYDDFINHDLYVSPNGNDANDGLSPASPLKTIAWALYRIASDSLYPKTIFLAPGVYNRSQNHQFFPLNIKPYINITGAHSDECVFDSEQKGGFIIGEKEDKYYNISNISFINTLNSNNPNSSISIYNSSGVIIQSSRFENTYNSITSYGYYFETNSVIQLKDLSFINNKGYNLSTSAWKNIYENLVFMGNEPYWLGDFYNGYPPLILYGNTINNTINNYEINGLNISNNNSFLESDWPVRITANAINIGENVNANIYNATITSNNVPHNGGPITFFENNSTVRLYNSILYGNDPNDIWFLGSPGPNFIPNHLYVNNCNLEGGQASIQAYYNDLGTNNIVHWGEGNIDADPMFQMEGEHPYQLGSGSPCIDAGTLNIPDFTFPETDILGNPRIVGGSIDIGAYEYQGLNANFNAEPLEGQVPLNVQFTDQSSGPVFHWAWDFDCDGNVDSYEQNPQYQYTIPGNYSVRLVINNGESIKVKNDWIHVLPLGNEENELPPISNVSDPYPNPFRSRSLFTIQINQPGKTNITIYNIKGQKIKTLVQDQRDVGVYQYVWDGKDDKQRAVASGIYTIQFKHNNKVFDVKKVTLLK